MQEPLKLSDKFRWGAALICWSGIAFAIWQRNPLYFFPSVIPYMLVNWFSDRIDGES
jgi:hypothetical protein